MASSLTAAQVQSLRERLLAMRREIVGHVRGREERIREAGAPEVADEEDLAEQAREEHEALQLDAHERARLAEIDAALARIEAGTYGTSEESGDPIPFKRLEAMPTARTTVEEEERREKA